MKVCGKQDDVTLKDAKDDKDVESALSYACQNNADTRKVITEPPCDCDNSIGSANLIEHKPMPCGSVPGHQVCDSNTDNHQTSELSILLAFSQYLALLMNQWRRISTIYNEHINNAEESTTLNLFHRIKGFVSSIRYSAETCIQTSFLFSKAWQADFLYYEKNMNPVLGLLFCDRNHPLSFLERLDIEFCVYGWVYFTSALFALTKQNREKQLGVDTEDGEQLEEYKATNANKYIASFLLVSAPSMLLRTFLFYIFLCPCIVSTYYDMSFLLYFAR